MVRFPSAGFPDDPRLFIKTRRAALDPYMKPARLDLSVERRGYDISFTPAKLLIDNRPYFDSVGLRDAGALARDCARGARENALEAAARACEKGAGLARGATPGALAFYQLTNGIDRMLVCVQPQKPEIVCQKAELEVDYIKDDYVFDWDTGGAGAEYAPYDLSIWVEFGDPVKLR